MAGPIQRDLFPEGTEFLEGDILVGGVSLTSIVQTYGTPVFVYDETALRDRCREAASSFDDGVAFASKSFLSGAMARLAHEEGLCIDVATAGELDVVLRAGVPADRIVLHGNNKSVEEIERAIEVGIRRVVVDSFNEIDRIGALLGSGHTLSCMVRVTPGIEAHTHEFVQTGQEDTKFGFSLSSGDAQRAIDALRIIPGVEFAGIHTHIGSQIYEVEAFAATVRVLADLVATNDVRELCIGGGLGVAYVEGEPTIAISDWAAAVRTAVAQAGVTVDVLTAEPGRSIVARAGMTLYTVGTRKVAAGRNYLAVDGGMSDNPRPVLYGSGYEAARVTTPLAERDGLFRVMGKHCESGDFLIDAAALPGDVAPGDLVVTPVTGAYGYSMASNYNRVPRPPVVFVRDGQARLVLRRETLDDLARLEV
jgi:diaminopimelate decarboxylase